MSVRFTHARRAAIIAVALLAAGAAVAQSDDSAVSQAKSSGIVGEQADGYLGFAKSPPGDVKAAVDAINIKRRQIYTEIAAKQGATVQEVAAARGCDQLSRRVQPGQVYKGAGGWETKGAGPANLPGICG
ncbi:MAG: YdbL family protein [Sphingomonas sp.]